MKATRTDAQIVTPDKFRRLLKIPTEAGPVALSEIIEPWQRADFEALDTAWMRAAGMQTPEAPRFTRAYLERPRGHSKTSDLAVLCVWALAFAQFDMRLAAAAGDRDQARFLRDAVDRLVRANPWLSEILSVQNYRVTCGRNGASLDILAADANTNYGLLLDAILIDEVTHWNDGGVKLWESLFSTAAKRSHCLLIIISNAGMGRGSSWQWTLRESCRESADWYFSRLDGPRASWITAKVLDEQRRMLPGQSFDRLWLNQWTTGIDGALSASDVEACTTLDGPRAEHAWDWEPMIAGLDLGVKNDHSALVVLGGHPTAERYRLVSVQSWKPPRPGGQIDLEKVKEACLEAHRRYRLECIVYDPSQAYLMAQQLGRQGVTCMEFAFTPKNLDWMTRTLLEVFANRSIELYDDADLTRDLLRLQVVERMTGFRLQATRDENGHCDRGMAFAMALPYVIAWSKALQEHRDAPPAERLFA
ncbi:MAG: terminase large subunit [Pirellulales bacterium]